MLYYELNDVKLILNHKKNRKMSSDNPSQHMHLHIRHVYWLEEEQFIARTFMVSVTG
jgi:hypothetical protein